MVARMSAATVRHWLRAERIKPWQYRYWQKPVDPRFLEKATPVLKLYEQAAALAPRGEVVVCVDEKTCRQALRVSGGVTAAQAGQPVRVGCRYQRGGITNLFAALLVYRGETMARFYERKRFGEFQNFLQMVFASLWCVDIRVLRLILDNGPTHAPRQIEPWLKALALP